MPVQHHPFAACLVLAAGLLCAGGTASAQDRPALPGAPPPGLATPAPMDAPAPDAPAAPSHEAQLATLYAELAQPGREDWERIQAEIVAIWSRSGSPAMDLLLRRGQEALEAGDATLAIERLDALTDHAPEFAEGWNARATAWYLKGEFALSLADIEHTLTLNPHHFGALAGLGAIYEELGDPVRALAAMKAVRALNPNHPGLDDAIRRLEAERGLGEI